MVRDQKIQMKLFIYTLVFVLIAVAMPGCFTMRMSNKEIDKAFIGYEMKPTQHTYDTLDRTINYAEIGNDTLPTVVFVHGSPGAWGAFVNFMKDTSLLAKVKMVAVDRPGFGYSGLGKAEESLEKQSLMLKPVVEKYKANGKKLILVGHSLGGPVIARMYMDYPELIDALVFVAPSISPELEHRGWYRPIFRYPPVRWVWPRSFKASNDEIYNLKEELKLLMPLWEKVTVPVTIIQGTKDMFVPKENADFGKEQMVNTKVDTVILKDVNHFIPWSNPETINDAILKYVAH